MTNALAVTLPVPALAIIALESDTTANIGGTLNITLPVPQLALTIGNSGSLAIALEPPAISMAGTTATVAAMRIGMPTPAVAMVADLGNFGSIGIALPAPQPQLASQNTLAVTLPTPRLTLVGTAGVIGNMALYPPALAAQLTGQTQYAGVMSMIPAAPSPQLTGYTGQVLNAAIMLPRLALAMEGVTGTIGNVAITLPMCQLSLNGGERIVGQLQISLPLLYVQLNAQDTSPVPVAQQHGAIVMHTEAQALSQYDNFPFNSFARLGNVYLGASDEGVFAIGGDTDDGAIIAAAARVGISDFGTSLLKRVDRAYIGYRTDGNLIMRVITDEVNQRDYLVEASGASGLHGNHVRIGRGLRARYWQFEILNQNGADFELNMIELKPTRLHRRIGGGDA